MEDVQTNICTRNVIVEKHNPYFEIEKINYEGKIVKVRRCSDNVNFHLKLPRSENVTHAIVKFCDNKMDVFIKIGQNDKKIFRYKINQILLSKDEKFIGIDGSKFEGVPKESFLMFRPVPNDFKPVKVTFEPKITKLNI